MKHFRASLLFVVILFVLGLSTSFARQTEVIDQGELRVEAGSGGVLTTLVSGTTASWILNMQEGLEVTIAFSGDGFTPHVSLIAPDETVVEESDSGQIGPIEVPVTGEYILLVDDPNGVGGIYDLSVTFDEDFTSFNTTKGEIALGETSSSDLVAGKHDIWTFQGEAGQVIIIELEFTDGAFDPYIELKDESGNVLVSDGVYGDTVFQIAPIELPSDGTYSIAALSNNPDTSGAYTLTLRLSDADEVVAEQPPQEAITTLTPTQDAGIVWVERFNHNLGMTYLLPEGFELSVISGRFEYVRGDEEIRLTAFQTSPYEPNDTIYTYCEKLADEFRADAPEGIEINSQVMQEFDPAMCKVSSPQSRTTFIAIILQESYQSSLGQSFQYISLNAPNAYADTIAYSLTHVDSVSAKQYLDEALRLIQARYVYLDQLAWGSIYQEAMASLDGDGTIDVAMDILDGVAAQLSTVGSHDSSVERPFQATVESEGGRLDTGYRVVYPANSTYPVVGLIYPGSWAEQAGLQLGDVIELYNGADAQVTLIFYDLPHVLGVRRPGEAKLLEFEMQPNIYSQYIPPIGRHITNDIGYVETFGMASQVPLEQEIEYATDTHNLIRELDQSPTCGWILDVRRNTGGGITLMNGALGALRGEGRWWGRVNAGGETEWLDYAAGSVTGVVDGTLQFLDGDPLVEDPYLVTRSNPPVAVLVSPMTASMGEMSAYIFRSRPDANTRIFGEPTRGLLGDTITTITLFDGATVTFPTYLSIDVDSNRLPLYIEPDVMLNTDYSVYGTGDDPLIQAATEWLQAQPACNAEVRFVDSGGGAVNLRSGPGTGFDLVGTLEDGTEIQVIGQNETGEWLEIIYGDGTAWIADFLTTTTP